MWDNEARCKNCKWWEEDVVSWGACELADTEADKPDNAQTLAWVKCYATTYSAGELVTAADFGCVQFEKREAE